MKVRQRRPRDAGSVVSRRRADGSESFMLKWKTYTRTVEAASKREAMGLLPAFVAEAQSGDVDREREAAKAKGEQPTLSAVPNPSSNATGHVMLGGSGGKGVCSTDVTAAAASAA